MSLLENVLCALLAENKIDDLKRKFPNMPIESIVDPTSTKKYVPWAVKQLRSGVSLDDVNSAIEMFHKNVKRLTKRDITSYSSLDDVESAIRSLARSRSDVKRHDVTKLYDDGTVMMCHVDSHAAAKMYGSNTEWCITMDDVHYWREYRERNRLFYIVVNRSLDVNDKFHKVAIAIDRDRRTNITQRVMLWNSVDNIIWGDVPEFLSHVVGVAKRDAATREKNPEVFAVEEA